MWKALPLPFQIKGQCLEWQGKWSRTTSIKPFLLESFHFKFKETNTSREQKEGRNKCTYLLHREVSAAGPGDFFLLGPISFSPPVAGLGCELLYTHSIFLPSNTDQILSFFLVYLFCPLEFWFNKYPWWPVEHYKTLWTIIRNGTLRICHKILDLGIIP